MLELALGLERAFDLAKFEDDDAAGLGQQLAASFVAAIRDNPRHGINWWSKHGGELRGYVLVALPGLLPLPEAERDLEGDELAWCVLRTFPGSWRLPKGMTARDFDALISASYGGGNLLPDLGGP